MYLSQLQLFGVFPFGDVRIPFARDGEPRMITVIHGSGGTGKTSILKAISGTRPGYATMLQLPSSDLHTPPYAMCEWLLGDDDASRPHPLLVITPNVKPPSLGDTATLYRREQMLFDRRAKERGFAFVAFPTTRWFSRQSIALNAPVRTLARYDVRQPLTFDDAGRNDLTRESKQALCYAAAGMALSAVWEQSVKSSRPNPQHGALRALHEAMISFVNEIIGLAGCRYHGVDPISFEPMFTNGSGRMMPFEGLPRHVRHLVAFTAVTVRAVWAANPGRSPQHSEGVVLIDDLDLHQDDRTLQHLLASLRGGMPRIQWVVSTSSAEFAATCATEDVIALRQRVEDDRVELYRGAQAVTH
jgi:hypothetical protein